MAAPDDYTTEEMEAMTRSADQSASWDLDGGSSSNANDLFLMSANLRDQSGGDLSQLRQSLFKGYSLQPLDSQRQHMQQPARTTNPADDLASMLSRFESSSMADSLASGAPLSSLNDYDDFDSSSVLKMVDDLEGDEDEVAAAKSAASAWGAPTRSPDAYGFGSSFGSTPMKSHIPTPGSSPAPLPAPHSTPNATPSKGVMSLADLEKKLKGASAGSPSMSPQASPVTPSKDAHPSLANLPAALHHLVLSGQTAPQQSSPPPANYSGPPLPHFQHGSPAPQGLSVDNNDRQHFYIPLPRSQHGLGFMTKSEIALVFRIQLSQLQTIGDPLSDDFYYQVMQARKGGKINSSGQAILPVFKSGQARNEDGSPKLPEGTLGRISAFSIHKPKKLMAIGDASSSASEDEPQVADDQPRKSNMFATRTLNYLIEEGYRCLMDLEDVDALLASLAPQRFEDPVRAFDRQRLAAQRADLCVRLLESLDLDEIHVRMNEVASGDHLIFKFFALPKGRLLLYRSLVLLNPPNTYQLVDVLMHDLTQISMPAVAAPSTDEKLIFLISDLIYSMPLLPYANEIFSYFLSPKHAPHLVSLIRTHMLCNFLQVLFKKGHEASMILQQNPHVPEGMPGLPGIRETVQQWRSIFDGITARTQGQLATIFEGLPKDAKPVLPPTATQIAARNRRDKEKEKAAGGDKKGEEKKEDKKPASASSSSAPADAAKDAAAKEAAAPAVPSFLSTRFGMWELMAAFFSHANPEQHQWLDAELREVLLKEVEMLYGEYREKKEKQAAAQAEKDKEAAEVAKEKEAKPAAAAADGDKKSEEAPAASPAPAAGPTGPRRNPNPVPPAASLPPPPSPALRFLSSALLGEGSPEFQGIARVWHDLHNDYMYYQLKHQQKVQQEQSRLAQQQQMRQQRQMQQQRQWQQFQQGNQRNQIGQSPNRPHVPPQHQHFHQSPQQFQGGQQRGGFQQQGQQQQQHQQGGQPHRGGFQQNRGGYQGQQQQQQQAPPQAEPSGPAKPVPVWVKSGTSGATAVKTPVKPSPAK